MGCIDCYKSIYMTRQRRRWPMGLVRIAPQSRQVPSDAVNGAGVVAVSCKRGPD